MPEQRREKTQSVLWRCPNGCREPKAAWWPAPPGGKTPPCSQCDAPLEPVTTTWEASPFGGVEVDYDKP